MEKISKYFISILLIGVLIILYSHFIGTKGLVIREYKVSNKKIPDSFDGTKIVHFSDLHYGSTIKIKEVKNLVDQINSLKPDIVVFTGDLIEESYNISNDEIKELTNELNRIESNLGKYFINGNHDVQDAYSKIISNINFKDLNNKNEIIYYNDNIPIRIVGLDDYLKHTINIDEAFNYEDDDYYTILIVHEPDVIDKLKDKNIDLILAGHSHNGQIRLPFIGSIYTPEGAKKYYDEKYELNNTTMFISGGIGTSSVTFRLLCKPSFNFYRLYNK